MAWWFIPSIIGVVAAGILAGLVISVVLLRRQRRTMPFSLKQYLHTSGIGHTKPFHSGNGHNGNGHNGGNHNGEKLLPSNAKLILRPGNSGSSHRLLTPVPNNSVMTLPKPGLRAPAMKPLAQAVNNATMEKPALSVKNDPAIVKPAEQVKNEPPVVQPYSRPGNGAAAVPPVPVSNDTLLVKPSGYYTQNEALVELENNLSIATRPVLGKPVPFQTHIWNNRRSEYNVFPADLRRQISESYVDMLLANDVVWLITELGRDSAELKNSYTRLKNKVAERLQQTMPAVWKVFQNNPG
ncbi:MAG: hypothetical protein PHU23_14900 [Dehalococcoidales bacterium]|nr:hypothetical protein [Dehalococcoidales bacterium]